MVGLAGPVAAAGSTPREAVEAGYAREARAYSLKFVNGILSTRTPGFKAYAYAGLPMDLRSERAQLTELLKGALSAQEHTDIKAFHLTAPTHAVCSVHQTLEIVRLDRARWRPLAFEVQLESTDEWVRSGGEWRELSCHITRERVSQHQAAASVTDTP